MRHTEEETEIACANYGIPQHMWGAVVRYLHKGIHPGDFLAAVIENDLKEAVGRADDFNQRALPAYIKFFYNYAPGRSWGYAGAIQNWQKTLKEMEDAA